MTNESPKTESTAPAARLDDKTATFLDLREVHPEFFDPATPFELKNLPPLFECPKDDEPIPESQIPHWSDVPNSDNCSAEEYRRRLVLRAVEYKLICALWKDVHLLCASSHPYYRCNIYTPGVVYSKLKKQFLLPYDTIPRDLQYDRNSCSYRREIQEHYDRYNEKSASFDKMELWVERHIRKTQEDYRVLQNELFIYDPDKTDYTVHPDPEPVLWPPLPQETNIPFETDQSIASIQSIQSTPTVSAATDELYTLPPIIENAATGSPADTENQIHETANCAIRDCRALVMEIATSTDMSPEAVQNRSIRLKQLLTASKVLLHLRELHRPITPKGRRGRPPGKVAITPLS